MFELVMRFNSQSNMDKWGFIAKKQGEGVSGWKITRRRHGVGGSR